MNHQRFRASSFAFACVALLAPAAARSAPARGGALDIIGKHGKPLQSCPLKRTEASAEISGFLARVTVTQHFENPLNERIEAVYTFPLPQNAAVDDMTMWAGGRVIRGRIKPLEEAQAIYDAARQSGRTASLLEQERPNIFTQSAANILPGEKVKIVIRYVEPLRYEAGSYEFVFPMVVGPRFNPRGQVPDADRITPPVTPPHTRAGHDITIDVNVDAGVPLAGLSSPSHEIVSSRQDSRRATVRLKNLAVIPNKDFILKYDVAGGRIEDAVLAHKDGRGGFFTLILQPPARVEAPAVKPKELVFVLDTSGSMDGFPLEKSKEVMRTALANLNPRDTFNLITFSGDTDILFPAPVPATAENLEKARRFLAGRSGGGGTQMMKAIRAALEPSRSQEHVRVVAFLTDGYVGNDFEIIAEVKKYANARVFSFGIGDAVNRFLLDRMAEEGRGEVEYVTLADDGSAAAKRFFERIRHPLLTDIKLEFQGVTVTDVYPRRIPDLFSARPVIVQGRYLAGGTGTARLIAAGANGPLTRTVPLDLPNAEPRHEALAPLWARAKVRHLMAADYAGVQRGTLADELRNQITNLGLEFGLMTQYTAFVAVEERMVSEGGAPPRRIEVPVEMPSGVSYQGVFGSRLEGEPAFAGQARMVTAPGVARGPAATYQRAGAAERPASPPAAPKVKLHPALSALLANPNSKPAFLVNGKAEVRVYLLRQDEAVLSQLRALGLEILPRESANQMAVGRILPANLEALSRHAGVRYIAPR